MQKTGLAFILVLLIGIVSMEQCNAQSNYLQHKVSCNYQNISIDSVLENLSQQCACYFSYNDNIVDAVKTISYYGNDVPLSNVLDTILPEDVFYNEFKNQIILFYKKAAQQAMDSFAEPFYYDVSGTIVDSLTNEPLPYVTIAIAGEFYGTVSNHQGDFSLKVPHRFSQNDLVFSSIGYYNSAQKVSSLSEGIVIRMSAAVVSLQEVMVRSVGAILLLRKAQAKFNDNYYQDAYGYTAFYRESIRKNEKYFTYSEALLKGYKPKMNQYNTDKMVLMKARKYSNANETDTLLVKLKAGMDACLRLDLIRNEPDFLAEGCETLYDYNLQGVCVWEDQLVHVLAFKPEPGAMDAYFEGELYIGVDDVAIHGAEFGYSQHMMGKLKKTLILRKSNGIKVKPISTNYYLKYNNWNGKYFIQHVRGEMVLKAKQRKQLKYAHYYTNLEMVSTQIDTMLTEKPNRKQLLKTQAIFSEYDANTLDGFWQQNVTIKPEQNIMKAFNKSGFMLEQKQ